MKHSPTPWEQETYDDGDSPHELMIDANGKTIFDTANSDVAVIETEYDDGDRIQWDNQGRTDFKFVIRSVNAHDDLVAACEAALAVLPGLEVHSWPPGHKMKDHALALLRIALAKGKRS